MTDSVTSLPNLRPDARLVRLHAERGDPHARLASALADLEGADWGLLLSGEEALARQLAAMLGSGTLRIDARVRVSREALANAGLAAASLDADWTGARAAWLLEPDAEALARAARAGVRVIVDATLAPGGHWLAAGADLIVYRDSVTLCGHADAPLSALFGGSLDGSLDRSLGGGRTPEVTGAAPSDLSVALALRDVATLPLRLARAARTTEQLAARLGGAAQGAGPTALLLAPDAAPDTPQPLGGVRAAARSVPGGVLLTPGLEEGTEVLALLREARTETREREQLREGLGGRPAQREPGQREQSQRDLGQREQTQREQGRREEGRREQQRGELQPDFRGGRRDGRGRPERGERPERPERFTRPAPDARPESRTQEPQRFVFEAPEVPTPVGPAPVGPTPIGAVDADLLFPTPEAAYPAVPATEITATETSAAGTSAPESTATGPNAQSDEGEVWEPEIVFSGTRPTRPLPEAHADLGPAEEDGAAQTEPEAAPAELAAPEPLAPDLPKGKEDPAADLSDEQAAVYARLREWRNAEAKRQEISRFIIASNATLAEIARRVPFTLEDLKAVKGMGTGRIGKYGEKILEVVRG